MVRVKHRYLLLHILYPSPAPSPSSSSSLSSSNPSKTNHTLSIRRPTPRSLTPGLLLNLLRDAITELFGDWGVGVCKTDLMGTSFRFTPLFFASFLPSPKFCQYPLYSTIHTHLSPTIPSCPYSPVLRRPIFFLNSSIPPPTIPSETTSTKPPTNLPQ